MGMDDESKFDEAAKRVFGTFLILAAAALVVLLLVWLFQAVIA